MFRRKKEINKTDIAHEDSATLRKEEKRTIARMIVIILAAIAVVVALSIAWFVNNTRVHLTGLIVGADMKNVELKTYGSAGIHDDLLKEITKSGKESFWYELADSVRNFFETSSEKYAINWLLSGDRDLMVPDTN